MHRNREQEAGSLLGPYRVLDLTDEKGLLCGKILADLGADVIKVERPGGDSARNVGPFYHDTPDPEKSLFWFAFNTNKRGITLNIESTAGQEVFKRLVRDADFVIESFSPGYMQDLGLGYEALAAVNPRIIMTSITPFGQSGPYANFKGSDLVLSALGGFIARSGDADRPPVRISVPQAYLQASAHAAVGTMIAHHYGQRTGRGQHIDVSVHEAMAACAGGAVYWAYLRYCPPRSGPFIYRATTAIRQVYACGDGHIAFRLIGAKYGGRIRPLAEWMEEEGMAGIAKEVDWDNFDLSAFTPEQIADIEAAFSAFFLRHSKAELASEALRRGFMLLPLNSVADIWEDEQLEARDFWVDVKHPELGMALRSPGAPCRFSETPWRIVRRAPLIGEHNEEVYAEIGLSPRELGSLRAEGVV